MNLLVGIKLPALLLRLAIMEHQIAIYIQLNNSNLETPLKTRSVDYVDSYPPSRRNLNDW